MKNTKTNKNSYNDSFAARLKVDMKINYKLYLLILPVLAYYIIFCYKPMYGAIIAFKDYSPADGVWGSAWVGFKHFKAFFDNPDFVRILRNTLIISISSIVFGFPAPIILALLFNELKLKRFKAATQTLSYITHFISIVVVCGLIKTFVGPDGVIQQIVAKLTGNELGLLSRPECFVPIYIISDIWQGCGWNSIIFLAALSSIDQSLYEAVKIDGGGRWRQLWHVTLPGISGTIIVMFILRMGSLFAVGTEKILLLYNDIILDTSDVIGTYVYRVGLETQSWSYSSAVGLLNSVVNFMFLILTNAISKKYSETSLW